MQSEFSESQQRIIAVSLELFAENGYDATGMRLIAERSGLRPSSLYSHFAGKEAILDAILRTYESQMRATRFWDGDVHAALDELTPYEILARGFARILDAVASPQMTLAVRFILVETLRNSRVREFYRRWFERQDADAIRTLFEAMDRRGLIRHHDTGALTGMYRALLNHFTYEYFLRRADGNETASLRSEVDRQIQLFLELLQ